jgi:hypothetical protein
MPGASVVEEYRLVEASGSLSAADLRSSDMPKLVVDQLACSLGAFVVLVVAFQVEAAAGVGVVVWVLPAIRQCFDHRLHSRRFR